MLKIGSTIIGLIIGLNIQAQTVINWGEEVHVADGAIYGNIRPRLTLDKTGNPIVLMGNGNDGEHFIAKSNGSAFSTPVGILPNGMGTYISYWTGPDIEAKGDTVIAVFKALPFDSGNVYSVRSTDGGVTFSDTIRVDSHNGGMAWMPSMAMDASGNPRVVYMGHDGSSTNPRYIYTNSNDAGISYNPEQEIASIVGTEACDCCPAEITIQGNNEVMLYRDNDNNVRDIYAINSKDGGQNFSYFDDVDQLNWFIQSCPSTGPDGQIVGDTLYTVFASRGSGAYRVYITKSDLSTDIQFVSRKMLPAPTNSNGKQNYPRLTADGNTIAMAWAEAETSNYEIFCAFSLTGDVNDFDATKHQVNINVSGTQTNPDILVDNNVFHIIYQDYSSGDVIYRRGELSSVGISESNVPSFSVYPNPVHTNEKLTVKTSDNNSTINDWKVMTMSGQEVEIEVVKNGMDIEVIFRNELMPGNYLLRNGKTNTTTNFVVID